MAHSKQANKRIRQSERDRLANKAKMTRMKTETKKLMAGDKGKAQELLSTVCKVIDKAAKHSIIHQNTASRKKSRVTRAVASMA